MKSHATIGLEAIVVGFLLIIFVYLASFMIKLADYPHPILPPICDSWNSSHIMEVTLFLAGALFHLTAEYTGVNKAYVDQYYQ
jgi:hypothetical protein